MKGTGFLLLGGGTSGCIGVIIFAIWGNKDKWLPEHANNFFGKFIFDHIIHNLMGIVKSYFEFLALFF